MNYCATCGYPTVWSETNSRVWCSVYGDHPTVLVAGNLIHLCIEAPNNTRSAQWHRADRARRNAQHYPQIDTPGRHTNPHGNSHGCGSSNPQAEQGTIVA